MKTIIKSAFFALLAGCFLAACSSDDNTVPNNIDDTIQSGKWRVTYYWDDKDETSDYNGYAFEFKSGNILTATKGASTHNGTWSSTTDDSRKKLIINFSTPEVLEEISDDWKVIEMTEVKVKLEDVSGGDGSVDYLTFEKI
jgi:major membrane immunogen (membrane-anchored lipoprotein)